MEFKLSNAARAEIGIVELLNSTEMSTPAMEEIYLAVRKFGDFRFSEGYSEGYDAGYDRGVEEAKPR